LAYLKSKKIIDAHPTSVKYIFLAVIVWSYLEIVVHPHSEAACTFLKNMGLTQICQTIINYGLSSVWMFFHSLYHCVLDNSLLNAAGFFALFALVIAMLQTIYPYCLREIFGYPIIELDLPDLGEQKVEKLVFYAAAVIFFEVFGWYLAELILPKLRRELTQEKFLGIIWMLCVFLECVCYADDRAFDTAVLLVNSSLISSGD